MNSALGVKCLYIQVNKVERKAQDSDLIVKVNIAC